MGTIEAKLYKHYVCSTGTGVAWLAKKGYNSETVKLDQKVRMLRYIAI
jgi:hypothetical protein